MSFKDSDWLIKILCAILHAPYDAYIIEDECKVYETNHRDDGFFWCCSNKLDTEINTASPAAGRVKGRACGGLGGRFGTGFSTKIVRAATSAIEADFKFVYVPDPGDIVAGERYRFRTKLSIEGGIEHYPLPYEPASGLIYDFLHDAIFDHHPWTFHMIWYELKAVRPLRGPGGVILPFGSIVLASEHNVLSNFSANPDDLNYGETVWSEEGHGFQSVEPYFEAIDDHRVIDLWFDPPQDEVFWIELRIKVHAKAVGGSSQIKIGGRHSLDDYFRIKVLDPWLQIPPYGRCKELLNSSD